MRSLVAKLWTSEAAAVGLFASGMLLVSAVAQRQPVDVPTVLLPLATGLGVGGAVPPKA